MRYSGSTYDPYRHGSSTVSSLSNPVFGALQTPDHSPRQETKIVCIQLICRNYSYATSENPRHQSISTLVSRPVHFSYHAMPAEYPSPYNIGSAFPAGISLGGAVRSERESSVPLSATRYRGQMIMGSHSYISCNAPSLVASDILSSRGEMGKDIHTNSLTYLLLFLTCRGFNRHFNDGGDT